MTSDTCIVRITADTRDFEKSIVAATETVKKFKEEWKSVPWYLRFYFWIRFITK